MTMRIFIHDVGHGQAIHAFTPSGQVVAIDLGCSDLFSPLKWLRTKVSTIDNLIITHPHGDHIDEILLLFAYGFKVRQLWRPKWLTEQEVRFANQASYAAKLDRYFEISQNFSVPIEPENFIGNPTVNGGATISTFASNRCGRSNINNHSGVVVFEYLGVRVVVPGDNEPTSWRELLKDPTFVSATKGAHVFLASHHGRQSGYCPELFDEASGIMKPNLCVISDGRVQDTDATARFTYHASGWCVHSRGGSPSEDRYCVTTRSDGAIIIEIGNDYNTGNTYLSITKE